MVVFAYTLIRAEHSDSEKLVAKLKKLRFVKEVTSVYGEYDMVVKTETNSIEELNVLIYNELRKIPSLGATTTMITLQQK
ncbi:MAG: Lrp/AsnC ligand binding domain-containing protein [Candidatus Bathyarchaeota archaeon]|nr:Lrp/AsnC ligand binding domain-containing protein [Candidatus Bathyarchaeota archaeon]MDH5786953.1 Lrp/AsnC ligand binding domain-containing protein [Candidatus Bathyarchaeota archaeon]